MAYSRIGPISEAVIPRNVSTMVSNTKDVFHLGCISGGASSGTRNGYIFRLQSVESGGFYHGNPVRRIFVYALGIQLRLWPGAGYFTNGFPLPTFRIRPLHTLLPNRRKTITYKAYVSGVPATD
jgi:hypothetical protein